MPSPRLVLMQTLKKLLKDVRNQRYFVKRGCINWTAFPFTRHPFAVSLQMDETSFMKPQTGADRAKITFEMFTLMQEPRPEEPDIEDEVIDEIIADAEEVLFKIQSMRNSQGDPIIFAIDKDTSRIVEAHDTDKKVQGVVVMMEVIY